MPPLTPTSPPPLPPRRCNQFTVLNHHTRFGKAPATSGDVSDAESVQVRCPLHLHQHNHKPLTKHSSPIHTTFNLPQSRRSRSSASSWDDGKSADASVASTTKRGAAACWLRLSGAQRGLLQFLIEKSCSKRPHCLTRRRPLGRDSCGRQQQPMGLIGVDARVQGRRCGWRQEQMGRDARRRSPD